MQLLLRRWGLGIFALVLTVGIFLILAFDLVRGPLVSVTLGEPAPQDVVAPRSMTYVSNVLTDKAKQQAAASVADQYTQLDLNIARAQNNAVRSIFSFIDQVRADSMANQPTKLDYLQAVEGISIDEQTAEDILSLSQSEYMAARDNILGIVEDTMRAGVVEERLSDARREASLGAAFDLTPTQERVVRSLAPQYIVPNIFFDEVSTAELQQEAMSSVEPVTIIVTRDETVIRVGDIILDEDLEMLERMGLLRQETDWQRAISAFLASLLAVTIITIYWNLYFGDRPNTVRSLVILGTLILLFVLGAKLLMPSGSIFVYLYPAATLTILTAVVFEARLAIVITLAVAGLVGYIAQFSLEMATYAVVGGILAVLTLSDTQRINALFRAGLVAAVGNVAVILIFRLPQNIAPSELLTLVLLGVVNGPLIAAALSLAGLFIIGSGFRVTTSLQLQELSRLDHPLLQELLRRAPGTYHHSIMVANLAEQAAEKVKANSTLVRVGAFYHDVGKINRPPFFSENQNGGNPHDNLDPYSSARIIISHVQDGIELARRYRLPNRIRDFIAEHHGDRVLKVFYQKALDAADDDEEVDISRFRYKGPRPGSRESGIVQLADTVEATSSALRPSTEEEIEKLVTGIVDDHLKEGQLDNSGLTLGDIKTIKESFIETVKGRFHVRVKYPGNEELEVSAEGQENEKDSAPIDVTGESEQDGADGVVSQNNVPPSQPDPIPTGEAIAVIEELDEPVHN
jgi:putative nucleotidyltransferase with HDIG domain